MKFLNPIEKPMTANAAWVEIVTYFHDRPYTGLAFFDALVILDQTAKAQEELAKAVMSAMKGGDNSKPR